MAKAVYTFLSYPGECDTKLVEMALNDKGLSWMHSPVHDQDTSKKTGEPVKPHIHWYVGFSRKPMELSVFGAFVRSIDKAIKYDSREAIITDPLAAEEYATHENNPDKAHYSKEDIVFSGDWCIDDYTTATQRKEHEASLRRLERFKHRDDNDSALTEIIKMLGTAPDKIHSFSGLVAWSIGCGKLPIVRENAYFLRSYIDSMCTESRVQRKEDKQIAELSSLVNGLRESNEDLRERLAFAENSASCYYEQLFGESAPAGYEW